MRLATAAGFSGLTQLPWEATLEGMWESRTKSKLWLACLVGILATGCAYLSPPRNRDASKEYNPTKTIGDPAVGNENVGSPNRFNPTGQ